MDTAIPRQRPTVPSVTILQSDTATLIHIDPSGRETIDWDYVKISRRAQASQDAEAPLIDGTYYRCDDRGRAQDTAQQGSQYLAQGLYRETRRRLDVQAHRSNGRTHKITLTQGLIIIFIVTNIVGLLF